MTRSLTRSHCTGKCQLIGKASIWVLLGFDSNCKMNNLEHLLVLEIKDNPQIVEVSRNSLTSQLILLQWARLRSDQEWFQLTTPRPDLPCLSTCISENDKDYHDSKKVKLKYISKVDNYVSTNSNGIFMFQNTAQGFSLMFTSHYT